VVGLITATDYGGPGLTAKHNLPSRLLARIPIKSRGNYYNDFSRRLEEGQGSGQANKSQAMLYRQKFICILRSIGMLAYSTPSLFHDFFGSRVTSGVPVLTSLIYALSESDYGIPSDVTELALWIIKELIVVDSVYSKKLSDLHNVQDIFPSVLLLHTTPLSYVYNFCSPSYPFSLPCLVAP
jgi:hypothetical protein